MSAHVCENCGHRNRGRGDSDGKQRNNQDSDGLKDECRDKFKFHGLLRIYDTLVKDVSQTKGTKILNRHYTHRKEFLEDVTSLCTVGIVKNKLLGVISHMDNNNIEFFIENNESSKDEEKSLLKACDTSLKYWLQSHMKEQKVGFVTTYDPFVPLMQREETSEAVERNANKDKADEIKQKFIDNNIDWQIYCVSLSPPLDAVGRNELSDAPGIIQGLAQGLVAQNAKVKQVD